ncbi:MAG: ArsR family transcriptional regulator [Fibrobacterota bacterium]|nr:metalloregulator ArsR/SmtB family transcription factor [Fibrobacterota bacterium]QQS04713.1 MAG: ArsR family transcriptional regulator [Fibrobacterota bacterium]
MKQEPDLSSLLKMLSDSGRVRILWLLAQSELAVHELQSILGWGQSRLSTQLGQLKLEGLVQLRREGKWSFYALVSPDASRTEGRLLQEILNDQERREGAADRLRLRQVLETRELDGRRRFQDDSSYLGEVGVPARTWEIVARALFLMMPPLRLLDLGAGDGIVGCLAASAGHSVTLVDWSQAQLDRARSRARREGLDQIATVKADFTATGLPSGGFDRVVLSHVLHHAGEPAALLREARRLLAPGGMLWILDLSAHSEEWMRSEQGDFWLGFSMDQLGQMLQDCGFSEVRHLMAGSDPSHDRLSALGVSARV